MRILIVGSTGYSGSALVAELSRRGHEVTGLARHAGCEQDAFIVGDFVTEGAKILAEGGFDAAVVALREDPETRGSFASQIPNLLQAAEQAGTRLGFIGGAGTLLAPGGVGRVMDQPDFPEAFKPGGQAQAVILEALTAAPQKNWFYVSPSLIYGAKAAVESTGSYQRGVDEPLFRADGESAISGADLALAVADEIETPRARGSRFTVCAP